MISGKHFKTAFYKDYEKNGKKTLLRSMEFFKVDQPKNITVMTFLSYNKSTLPNKYFSRNYMRNIKF